MSARGRAWSRVGGALALYLQERRAGGGAPQVSTTLSPSATTASTGSDDSENIDSLASSPPENN